MQRILHKATISTEPVKPLLKNGIIGEETDSKSKFYSIFYGLCLKITTYSIYEVSHIVYELSSMHVKCYMIVL